MERKERTTVKLLILIPLIANILRVIGLLGSILLDAVIPVFITSHSKILQHKIRSVDSQNRISVISVLRSVSVPSKAHFVSS